MTSYQDSVITTDRLVVGLESTAKRPAVPCKMCGSETKEHHSVKDKHGKIAERRRICSNRACRKVLKIPWVE